MATQDNLEAVLQNVLKHELAQLRLRIQEDIQEELGRLMCKLGASSGATQDSMSCPLELVGKQDSNSCGGYRDMPQDKLRCQSGESSTSETLSQESLPSPNPMLKERSAPACDDVSRRAKSIDAGSSATRSASKENHESRQCVRTSAKKDTLRESLKSAEIAKNAELRIRLKALQDHDLSSSQSMQSEHTSEMAFGPAATEPSPHRQNSQAFRFPAPKRSNSKNSREASQTFGCQDAKTNAGIDVVAATTLESPNNGRPSEEEDTDDISF